jgi:hypothetical protein
VGVVAVVAMTMMKGGNAANANDSLGRDSGTIAAVPAPNNPDTGKNVTPPVPGNPPGTNRTPPNPGTVTPPRTDTAKGTTPTNPPPATANWADTLSAANDAFDADDLTGARRMASAIYAAPGVPGAMKARAAVLVATTYAGDENRDRQLQWYRNALRYEPDNARVRQAIIDLGGAP